MKEITIASFLLALTYLFLSLGTGDVLWLIGSGFFVGLAVGERISTK